MKEPIWLSGTEVLAFHEEQLREHGGLSGVRDENALEGALARPSNLFHYEKPDLASLAAVYAHGIAKNHPFNDGNKPTAFVCTAVFLGLNGVRLTLSEVRAVEMMLAVAAGNMSQEEVAKLIRENSGALPKTKG
ncbi:MAG: type II toxin-antitoxin system death-on-curing family toxin [Opitutaceae bacterium]